MSTTCKSCGAPILWVQLNTGKRMPVDAESQTMVVVADGGQNGVVRRVHASHFATCPNATQHRKKAP